MLHLVCSFENNLHDFFFFCLIVLLVLKDVLRRISKQPSELESHADHLYDTILASVDMLAGCTLIPEDTPVTHSSADVTGMSLVSRIIQENIPLSDPCAGLGYRAPALTFAYFLET